MLFETKTAQRPKIRPTDQLIDLPTDMIDDYVCDYDEHRENYD